MLVGKVPSPALSSTRLGLPSFPSSTSRSPSPSTSAAAIDLVDTLPPGSSMLVGKVPSPALSSTRLGLPSFPSSTSRSPSPSTSAAAIDNVDALPPGSSMLVGKVPSPALSNTQLGLLLFPSSTSRSPSPSTSAAAIDLVDSLLPGSSTRLCPTNFSTASSLPSSSFPILANGLGKRRHPGSEDNEHAGGKRAARTPGAGLGRAGVGSITTQPTRARAEQLGGANTVG
ncbi:hypothetical protein Ctob_004886 [Chrysochromulina tobinii]|uniref:Uncharacterized protein n=1 Tax=Chrysochromulina tobinii TaxID=1460289 RepID=A0A0M0JS34_9EUKA|nr:hypothetical protein Ctob_004886 [Chrysochromulina tobinii]|eukprot:KOO29008.1 hypothetical protein Ctob_004886 [Chrysochromulina sp. CCMP291]